MDVCRETLQPCKYSHECTVQECDWDSKDFRGHTFGTESTGLNLSYCPRINTGLIIKVYIHIYVYLICRLWFGM